MLLPARHSIVAAALMAVASFAAGESGQQARSLLESMVDASRALEYQGRFIYSQGGNISTMEVFRAVFDGQEYERLAHLDGDVSELIRQGREVVSVDRNRRITRLPPGESLPPLDLAERMKGLPEQYNVLIDGDDRVAGRDAVRMRVAPLDEHRYGYRLWLDRDSSLLLRSELVNENGRALERMEFISLELAPGLSREDFRVSGIPEQVVWNVEGRDDSRDDAGIEPGWLPEGFREVARDLRSVPPRGAPVYSRTFSDGLAAFTIFAEPVEDPGTVEEGISRIGPSVAINRYLESGGGSHLLTLVGEIPLSTAERVVSGLQGLSGEVAEP